MVCGTSLVDQWLGIHLPVQGTQVQPLVRELISHTLQGKAHHICWALHALELTRHSYWAYARCHWSPRALKPVLCNNRSHRNEKPRALQLQSSPCSLQVEKVVCRNKEPVRHKEDPVWPKKKGLNTPNKNSKIKDRNWQTGLMTTLLFIHDITYGPNYMLSIRPSLQI